MTSRRHGGDDGSPPPDRAPLERVAEPLTATAFEAFGDVIEAGPSAPDVSASSDPYPINDGTATRFDQAARIDVGDDGELRISVARARPRSVPVRVDEMERHPLGSQAFVPMTARRFLVVVAEGADRPDVETVRAFVTAPGQGIHYRRGVWHFPLSALDRECDFLVLDRDGPGENLEMLPLGRSVRVRLPEA